MVRDVNAEKHLITNWRASRDPQVFILGHDGHFVAVRLCADGNSMDLVDSLQTGAGAFVAALAPPAACTINVVQNGWQTQDALSVPEAQNSCGCYAALAALQLSSKRRADQLQRPSAAHLGLLRKVAELTSPVAADDSLVNFWKTLKYSE